MGIVKSKRAFSLILLSVCFVLALHLLGGILLQFILREVFSQGTGCRVSLENSRLHLFPISASTENVTIIHPEESPDAGFRAERISVELRFWSLFRKKVVLDNLLIEGASVHSFGSETGFVNTLAFLFPRKDESEASSEANPTSWHAPLTGNWKVWVPLVQIAADPEKSETFVLGEPEAHVAADKVFFESKDPTGEPEDPAIVSARASQLKLNGEAFKYRELGALEADGTIGGGVVRFTQVQLNSDKAAQSPQSQTHARGTIHIRDEGRYNIQWKAELHDAYLSKLLRPDLDVSQDKATLSAKGSVGGDLLHPVVESSFTLEARELPTYVAHSACIPEKITGTASGSLEHLSLQDLSVDTLIQAGEARLDFSTSRFQSNLTIITDAEIDYIRKCFRSKLQAVSRSEQREAMVQALTTALQESVVKLSVEGGLEPLSLEARIDGEMNRSDARFQSRIDSKLELQSSKVKLSLRERGLLPQILPEPPSVAGTIREVTKFQTATTSHIDIELEHDFDTRETNISRMDFTRYPLVKLLLRATPFLDQQLFSLISSEIDARSTIDGTAKAQVQPLAATASGKGSYVIREVGLTTLGVEEVTLPFRLSSTGLEIQNAVAVTQAGNIDLRFSVGAKGSLAGKIDFQDFALRELPIVQSYFPELSLLAGGGFSLRGSLEQPQYSAAIRLRTEESSNEASPEEGYLKLEGDAKAVRINATLFDEAGVLNLHYPFAEGKRLVLDAYAKEFPLEFLLPQTSSESGSRSSGELSASLHYEGDPDAPLLGAGELRIDTFEVVHEDLFLNAPRPLLMRIENQRLDFGQSTLGFNTELLTVSGYLDAASGWNTNIQGAFAIGEYLADLPQIEQLSGNVRVNLSVRGELEKPSFFGSAELVNGSVSVPLQHTVVGADEVRASLNFDKTSLKVAEVSARVGGGRLLGSGELKNFLDFEALQADATFHLDEVAITPVENSLVQFAGPVRVSKNAGQKAFVESEITVSSALYESEISLREIVEALTSWLIPGKRSVLLASSAEGVARRAEGEALVGLDLVIRAENGIVIDTSFAQAELSANFRVSGDPSNPKFRGKVEVLEGHFGFQSTQFDIVAGSVSFSDRRSERDPELELVGESRVQTITGDEQLIRVIVSGRLSEPVLHFSSDSGLSERDIVALLGAGSESGAGISILKSKREPRTFRELISPASDLSLSDRLVGLTGFDDVQIQTELSQATGEFVPSVVATRPVTERVDLKIQTELSGERTSEVGVRYPLTPYLEFVSGWSNASVTSDVNDGSGSYEIGVRYRKTFSGYLFWKPKELKEE